MFGESFNVEIRLGFSFLYQMLRDILEYLLFLYDEYEDEGVNREKLDELYENIRTSLDAVSNAINIKLDEIHTFQMMETKARAKALADIIGQDGYTIKHDFNGIN